MWEEYIAGSLNKAAVVQNKRRHHKGKSNTTVKSYNTQRMKTFRETYNDDQGLKKDAAFGSDSEDEYDDEEELSEDFDSSEDEMTMLEYDNELTRNIWLPQEPRLFALYIGGKFISYSEQNWAQESEDEVGSDDDEGDHEDEVIEDPRTHSEIMDMKNITNFDQKFLKSQGIFLLDYDSEVFIWVGKDVPDTKLTRVYARAARAIRAISCKGKKRVMNITISLTFQGYEPTAFQQAFTRGWEPFPRQGIDNQISEADESESSDEDNKEEPKAQYDSDKSIDEE